MVLQSSVTCFSRLFLSLPQNSTKLIVRVGRFFLPDFPFSSATKSFILRYISSPFAKLSIFSSILSIAAGSNLSSISASLSASSNVLYLTTSKILCFGSGVKRSLALLTTANVPSEPDSK